MTSDEIFWAWDTVQVTTYIWFGSSKLTTYPSGAGNAVKTPLVTDIVVIVQQEVQVSDLLAVSEESKGCNAHDRTLKGSPSSYMATIALPNVNDSSSNRAGASVAVAGVCCLSTSL